MILGSYSLSTLFLFLLPMGWGGGRAWVLLDLGFATLPFAVRSTLFPTCRQSASDFFPVTLSGSVLFAVFSYYMCFLEEVSVSLLMPLSLSLCRFLTSYEHLWQTDKFIQAPEFSLRLCSWKVKGYSSSRSSHSAPSTL